MNNIMIQKGDYVVYGSNGLFIVEDIGPLEFAGDNKIYYVLRNKKIKASTIYIPSDNQKLTEKIRPAMTKNEIDQLIISIKGKKLSWISDRIERIALFQKILSGGLSGDLLLMMNCIFLRSKELQSCNKKLPNTDAQILYSAEKIVNDEFAHVLQIQPSDVGCYIRAVLGIPEPEDLSE